PHHQNAEEEQSVNDVCVSACVPHPFLPRLLVFYPWTQRFFASFSKLSNPTAILGSSKIQTHDKKVLAFFREAVKNLDNIKKFKMHVDLENVRIGIFPSVLMLDNNQGSWVHFLQFLLGKEKGYFTLCLN
uniref:Globin domain-containing protein n=1 Tax=Nothoprocta perdicaria TaxID=30464 RepID=A0A8C6ZNL2_NOTPE